MGVYGPNTPLSDRAIPTFIHLIELDKKPILFGTGNARRNHVYIDDAVNSIISSLQIKHSTTLNIGGFESISNIDLINLINKIFKKNIEPLYKKSNNKEFDFIEDIEKAKQEINYSPKINMDRGLTEQIYNTEKNLK